MTIHPCSLSSRGKESGVQRAEENETGCPEGVRWVSGAVPRILLGLRRPFLQLPASVAVTAHSRVPA